jgi:hypothetical protein
MSSFYATLARKIDIAKAGLKAQGFTKAQMDLVFGEEDLFYPTTRAKVEQTKGILDNLIANKQIKKSDKALLSEMVDEAYNEFREAGKPKKTSKNVSKKTIVDEPIPIGTLKETDKGAKGWKAIPMAGKIGIISGGVLLFGLLTFAIVKAARN